MNIIEIINIIAIIIIPIVSVVIGQYLQNRSEKRKDKVEVFKTLMTYRNSGYTDSTCVKSLNLIPILFIKDKKVMNAYNDFVKLMNTTEKNSDTEKQIAITKVKLLEEIAKSLKYNKINWEIINTPYLPPETLINQQMGEQLVKNMATIFKTSANIMNEDYAGKLNESLALSIERDKLDIKQAKSKAKKSSKK